MDSLKGKLQEVEKELETATTSRNCLSKKLENVEACLNSLESSKSTEMSQLVQELDSLRISKANLLSQVAQYESQWTKTEAEIVQLNSHLDNVLQENKDVKVELNETVMKVSKLAHLITNIVDNPSRNLKLLSQQLS